MTMDKLKKYREILSESSTHNEGFSASFERSGGDATLDIDNPPPAWKSPYVTGGKARWELDIYYKSSGLEINGASLLSLGFSFTVEDPETGEELPDEIEIELSSDDIFYTNTESEIGKPDYFLNSLEVDMNNSEDSSNWKYLLDIGS
jgi:hypothetical protein